MVKLDAKTKGIIRKDSLHTCGYIYTDGIVIRSVEEHTYKGETYRKDILQKFPGEIPISLRNGHEGSFIGRLVVHNPTLLLDGVARVQVYRDNKSDAMKDKNLYCDSVSLTTISGLRISENIFSFISSDFCIQNEHKMSIEGHD
jgi:hypothetical protein